MGHSWSKKEEKEKCTQEQKQMMSKISWLPV